MKPVVDHGRHKLTLVRRGCLLLDHRRDDQHVVGGQILRARIAEIDSAPVLAERIKLVLHELCRGRLREELVRRREEEALDRPHLGVKAGRYPRLARRRDVPGTREVDSDLALVVRDLRDRGNPLGHLLARESFREHDMEGLGHRQDRFHRAGGRCPGDRSVDEVRERGLLRPDRVVPAADGCDSEPAEAPEDQDEHAESKCTAKRDLARVRRPRRPARPRRDHAGALLAHVR